jgi:zinc transporter ZupT
MALAWLLTLLALAGAWAGAYVGRKERFAEHLAAAGGGLLFGVSLFGLIPEISETLGRPSAALMVLSVALLLGFLDWVLSHSGHSARHGVIWPLLAATALHSFLDGWSVRALAMQPVTIGLALHKIPEGVALGWILRRSLGSRRKAILAAGAPELLTLAGAFVQPGLNASGYQQFGERWTAGALAMIAGGFVFLGFHAVIPHRKRRDVMAVFAATLLLMAGLSWFHAI